MSTIIFKVALSKTAFNLSSISFFLLNQPFQTFYTREYKWDSPKHADYLYTNYSKYTYSHAVKKLSILLEKSDFFCEAAGHNTYLWITQINTTVLFSVAIPEKVFMLHQTYIENYLNNLFKKENVIAAYISNINDTWWLINPHEQPSLFNYRRLQHSRYNNCFHRQEVLYQNFSSDEIWHPLCWKFWINIFELQEYSKFLQFKDIILCSKLSNHSYRFQLCPISTHFRSTLHTILYNDKYSLHSDSDNICEIQYPVVPQKTTLKLIRFLNQEYHPTSKNNATYQEISIYLMCTPSLGKLLSKQLFEIKN